MLSIIFISVFYIVGGVLSFMGIQDILLDDNDKFNYMKKSTRIAIRLAIILLWPISSCIFLVIVIYNIFCLVSQGLWKEITK